MKKRFILVVLVIVSLFSFSACNNSDVDNLKNEINELQAQIEALTQENTSLEEEKNSLTKELDSLKGQVNSSDTALISIIFWKDGNTYYVENCQFYSDCFCSDQVKSANLRFYTPICFRIQLSNGNNVYLTLSNNGIVWSVDKPYFREVELEK